MGVVYRARIGGPVLRPGARQRRSGAILGGHIAGPEAGEMIHEVVAAMAAGATVRDLAEALHAFPNFAEGVKAATRKWVEERQAAGR